MNRAADHVVEVLEQVPLFRGLPRSDLEQIAQIVKRRELKAGEFLFREGDAGDRLYLVAAGAVEALKERPLGENERLAIHRSGDAFGAMAVLDDAPRSASARAIEDARLLSISRADFHALLGGDSFALRLIRGLARSVRTLDAGLDGANAEDGADGLRQFGRVVLQGLEPRAVPHADGFRIAAGAARQDSSRVDSLWDALSTDDGRVLMALLDVQGQGLPPAYLIGVTRAVLHEVATEEPFERLLGRLNSATFKNLFEGLDACVEAALIELVGGRIRWSCARDQAGVIIRAGGSTEEAPSQGPPLGILPAFEYGVATLDVGPGDTFLALTEASSGLARGAVDLVRSRPDAEPAELAKLLAAALGQVQTHGESDVAFVVVRKA